MRLSFSVFDSLRAVISVVNDVAVDDPDPSNGTWVGTWIFAVGAVVFGTVPGCWGFVGNKVAGCGFWFR